MDFVSVNLIFKTGERVVGRGSDLYQLCKDIDDTIKGDCESVHCFNSRLSLSVEY